MYLLFIRDCVSFNNRLCSLQLSWSLAIPNKLPSVQQFIYLRTINVLLLYSDLRSVFISRVLIAKARLLFFCFCFFNCDFYIFSFLFLFFLCLSPALVGLSFSGAIGLTFLLLGCALETYG